MWAAQSKKLTSWVLEVHHLLLLPGALQDLMEQECHRVRRDKQCRLGGSLHWLSLRLELALPLSPKGLGCLIGHLWHVHGAARVVLRAINIAIGKSFQMDPTIGCPFLGLELALFRCQVLANPPQALAAVLALALLTLEAIR